MPMWEGVPRTPIIGGGATESSASAGMDDIFAMNLPGGDGGPTTAIYHYVTNTSSGFGFGVWVGVECRDICTSEVCMESEGCCRVTEVRYTPHLSSFIEHCLITTSHP